MTRKITLSIILILLILGCYELLFGNQEGIRQNVASVQQLDSSSKELSTAAAQLERSCGTDFEEKKNKLKKTIQDYEDAKEEYDSILPQVSGETADAMVALEENQLKDIYDVDFLWTILGNYATEEGVNLKFDINKNTTSASSMNNSSDSYVVCDLKFVVTGKYINLTDFIYDIEDDDRLNFEINNFDMQKEGDSLQITLNVKEIKINSNNLIENTNHISSTDEDEDTQTIGSNTVTNTEKTNTTTNTASNNVTNTQTANTTVSNDVN